MNEKIYVLRDGERLAELIQTPYDDERVLQALLERHPTILAGEQITPDNPRKWVLISREMGVPLDDGRGHLDHLYIDQDAMPTFVEVKRSENRELNSK